MKKIMFITVLVSMLIPCVAQPLAPFAYPRLDAQLVSLWMTAEHGIDWQIKDTYAELKTDWSKIREDILNQEISHLNTEEFVQDQDHKFAGMQRLIDQADYQNLAQQAFEAMQAFQHVRTYFTRELCALDDLLATFQLYNELHYAVDDPMLGLLDWQELTQLFSNFQQQFDTYVVVAEPGFTAELGVLFKLYVQRVYDCTAEFKASLESAQQDNFVAPCDDTRDALMNLLSLYKFIPSSQATPNDYMGSDVSF